MLNEYGINDYSSILQLITVGIFILYTRSTRKETASAAEMEKLKDKVSSLEVELQGLKAQLSAIDSGLKMIQKWLYSNNSK